MKFTQSCVFALVFPVLRSCQLLTAEISIQLLY